MLKIQTCADASLVARLGGMFCGDKQVVGFFLKQKGFTIDPATFDKEEMDKLIKEDKLIGMIDYYSVEDNDQEADYATSVNKVRVKTVEGVKGFRFMFSKGACFQNELSKLDGANYEVIPVFIDGSWLLAKNRDGKVIGFDSKLFVGIRRLQTGSEVAGSTLEIDILPSGMAYWQNNSVTLVSDEIAFNEVNPIEGIKVDFVTPIAGDTTLDVTITHNCSGALVSGLTTPTSWKLKRNGVEETVTSITEVDGTGKYKFTIPAVVTGDKLELVISVLGHKVYALDTRYYAISNEVVKTAV